jgi:hypothetical protein
VAVDLRSDGSNLKYNFILQNNLNRRSEMLNHGHKKKNVKNIREINVRSNERLHPRASETFSLAAWHTCQIHVFNS